MNLELRPITREEFPDFVSAMSHAFGWSMHTEEVELWENELEFNRTLCVFEDGRLVGTSGAISFEMTVPGGSVPTAGVTMVSVLPTHRRRGVLRSMMERQLADVRADGEPVAALWASESSIYGRFGYGMAAATAGWEIDRAHTRIAHSSFPRGGVRLVEPEEARKVVPDLYDDVRSEVPGFLTWPAMRWEWTWYDPEHRREGGSPKRYALYEEQGGILGACIYRQHSKWEDGFGTGSVRVRLLIARTIEAYESLWSHCFGIDLVTSIAASFRPVDEPLSWMLADPRRLKTSVDDGLWLRIVDVPAALSARRYGRDGRLVIEVSDDLMSGVGGRFLLEGSPSGATCHPIDAEPDLELDVQALASVYLGGSHLHGLRQAGRVKGALEKVRLADTMFRFDREPWSPMMF